MNTYILPSKQTVGPTISAAPLRIRKAIWLGGHTLERLHFGTDVGGAKKAQKRFYCGNTVILPYLNSDNDMWEINILYNVAIKTLFEIRFDLICIIKP